VHPFSFSKQVTGMREEERDRSAGYTTHLKRHSY
jgi:hypothetical protein